VIRSLIAGAFVIMTLLLAWWAFNRWRDPVRDFESPSGRAFLEAFTALHSQHRSNPAANDLMGGALQGMIAGLNDEATQFVPADTARSVNEAMLTGGTGGLGLWPRAYRADGTGYQVVKVMAGTPAQRAGLQPGDLIEAVDGRAVGDLPLQEIARLLRGPPGSPVRLLLRRGSQRLPVPVVRARIEIIAVTTESLEGEILAVRVGDFFGANTAKQLRAVFAALPRVPKGVILDLRDDAGGQIEQAVQVADFFLSQGKIFVTRDRAGRVRERRAAKQDASDYLGPLVVLVNHNTASAAEIVTAALQGNARARVIGERTHGKGVANAQIKLSGGAELLLPVTEWLTPSGANIDHQGLLPDVSVPDSRFPKPITLSGVGLAPNLEVRFTVNGQERVLRADAAGRFSGELAIDQPQAKGSGQARDAQLERGQMEVRGR
jgi:carboxyl-terminal processing protease